MSAKQAIREELKTLEVKIADLEAKRGPLQAALDALNGKGVPKYRQPSRSVGGKRKPKEARAVEILDYLRAHPDDEVQPQTLTRAGLMANSSARVAIAEVLIPEGKVEVIDPKVPIVKHKPTTVKPGEEVKP